MSDSTLPLPSPADLPESEVLIYDGHCKFCQGKVRTLRRLAGDRVAYLSLHDAEVARRFPDLEYDDLMREMVLVDRWGRRHGGAAAVRYLSRQVPSLWPLAPLLHIPGSLPLWQRLYQWVAVRRYRIGGHAGGQGEGQGEEEEVCQDACEIHLGK